VEQSMVDLARARLRRYWDGAQSLSVAKCASILLLLGCANTVDRSAHVQAPATVAIGCRAACQDCTNRCNSMSNVVMTLNSGNFSSIKDLFGVVPPRDSHEAALHAALDSYLPNPHHSMQATRLLRAYLANNDLVLTRIRSMVQSLDPRVRESALAVAAIFFEDDLHLLLHTVHPSCFDPDPDVRELALDVVNGARGRLRNRLADLDPDLWRQALTATDDKTRILAAEGLGTFGLLSVAAADQPPTPAVPVEGGEPWDGAWFLGALKNHRVETGDIVLRWLRSGSPALIEPSLRVIGNRTTLDIHSLLESVRDIASEEGNPHAPAARALLDSLRRSLEPK
jgi:hypothetical protein